VHIPLDRRGVCTKWYRSLKNIEVALNVLGMVEAMSLRIHIEPSMENHVVGRKMREICARLEAMEAKKR
jgi:hypothetical protein